MSTTQRYGLTLLILAAAVTNGWRGEQVDGITLTILWMAGMILFVFTPSKGER